MEGPIEVPTFFLCPISLQIMKDPVTVSTGISFDRPSIEQWIFSSNNTTTNCPMTMQPLSADPDLITPNHTLRRLIQAWCEANAVERFPTPRPPVDKSFIAALLEEAKLPRTQMVALRKLKAVIAESDRNKHVVEAAGAVDVLLTIIEENINYSRYPEDQDVCYGMDHCINNAGDESLGILASLQLSEQTLINILDTKVDFIELLTKILSKQNYNSRAYAVVVLKSLVPVLDPDRLASLKGEFFEQMLEVIKDGVSSCATKNALKVLAGVSNFGRNKVKAVRAGAVVVLVEQLLDESDKRDCELILAALDELCRCADGRAELVGHAAGIAALSEKMLGVSAAASGMALNALYAVAKCSPSPAVLNEMVQAGAVNKLFLLVQMGGDLKIREKIKEMLRLHSMAWRNSPCLTSPFHSCYIPLD